MEKTFDGTDLTVDLDNTFLSELLTSTYFK